MLHIQGIFSEACNQVISNYVLKVILIKWKKRGNSRPTPPNCGPWPYCATYKWWVSTPSACRRMAAEVRERLSQGRRANCRQVISLSSQTLEALDELQGKHDNVHGVTLTVHSSWPRRCSTHWYLSSLAPFRGSTSAANSRFSSAYSWPERQPADIRANVKKSNMNGVLMLSR